MPVEWWHEMTTEWWVELRIEVPSELPSELPSPRYSAGLSCESGRARTGERGADACWNRCGLSGLKPCRNRMEATYCDAGSDQMSVGRRARFCPRTSVPLERFGAGFRPPRRAVVRRASLPGQDDPRHLRLTIVDCRVHEVDAGRDVAHAVCADSVAGFESAWHGGFTRRFDCARCGE